MKGKKFAITILAAMLLGALFPLRASQADNIAQRYHETPPFITSAVSPKVMLVMGRNHKLFYEAYNDASDLNGDGVIDVKYKPDEIDYYGYFDSYKCYEYNTGTDRFEPSCDSDPETKRCDGVTGHEWSGDFLNYLTMSRMDALRKVLYGGKRSTDEEDETVLERAYIPQDAHSWGKSYSGTSEDGYDITKYSPLSQPNSASTRHLLASTTLSAPDASGDYTPLLRVIKNTDHKIWEWVAKERPVCGGSIMNPDGSEESVSIDDDYTVRVEVGECNETDTCGAYAGSMSYPNATAPKPAGLLQRYGKDGDMHFGLLTGSYTNNISGGVLRKNIGSIEDEIDQNTGEFTSSEGIIYTIDRLRIINFDYSNHEYDGGWYTAGPMSDSGAHFPDWGNPLAEMLYEALNYYGGESETSSFTYSGDDGGELDLPQPSWQDPYNSTDYCAEAHILTISDIYPTFDSDEVPGAKSGWRDSSFSSSENIGNAAEALDVKDIGDEIFNEEFGSSKNRFIGCSNSIVGDFSCSAKNVNSLGNIRGLCPEEPTKEGSYYSASVAHYGHTNDLSSVQGNQTITSYMVGLSSPRPHIEIPVLDDKVTVIPFAKSVGDDGGYNITADENNDYQPTNTIVDYFVESIGPTSGSFRINFEDVEQGADHDMDAIVRYTYQLVDGSGNPVSNATAGSEVKITVESEYAAGSIIQHLGYIISGTQNDGTYLVVRDTDLDGDKEYSEYSSDANSTDVAYFLDDPETEDDLGLSDSRTFVPSSGGAATTLKNPLWYAAKWGGFEDQNDDGIPDQQIEWDADGDGKPDSYFYVQNPLKLEEQLNKVFAEILQRTSSGTSIASLTERTTSGALISQAVFYPRKRINGNKVNWLGYLYSYWFLNKLNVQNLREDTPANKTSYNPEDKKLDILGDRILQFNSTATNLEIEVYNSSTNGSIDEQVATYNSLGDLSPVWEAGKNLRDRNATDRDIYGVTQNDNLTEFVPANATYFEQNFGDDQDQFPSCLLNGTTPQYSKLIRFLRGEDVSGCRTRKTGNGVWKLGDIIHSTPETVYYPDKGYSLVFTGANDGMLHAFRMGKLERQRDDLQPTKLCNSEGDCSTDKLGREEWAFIPKNAMPYLRYTAFPSYSHINTVDLKPYVIQKKGNGKKILIGGMRFGGGCGADAETFDAVHPPSDTCADRKGSNCTGRSAYFALDVTDPQNPEYMWSFSPPKLGYSFSGPAYIKRKDTSVNPDQWKHYLMFASGPTSHDGYSDQGLRLFVRELETGDKVHTFGENNGIHGNAFGGRLFTDGLDVNGDYQTDFVFLGHTQKQSKGTTSGGGVMKIWTGATASGEPDPENWHINKNYLNNSDNPVVSRVIPMQCFGDQWYLYFGTGRYFYATDNDMDTNYLYGLPFTCDAQNNCDTGNINSAHNSETMDCGDIYMKGTNPNKAGWKRKLKEKSEITGDYMIERNYADPSPTEFNVVFFNPAMPTSDPCGFGGKSRSFALNCVTGKGLMNDDCSDKYTVESETFKYLVQLSGGDIKQYSAQDFSGGGGSVITSGVPSEEGGVPMTGSSTEGKIMLWLEK